MEGSMVRRKVCLGQLGFNAMDCQSSGRVGEMALEARTRTRWEQGSENRRGVVSVEEMEDEDEGEGERERRMAEEGCRGG
jgi:hypothetical protein